MFFTLQNSGYIHWRGAGLFFCFIGHLPALSRPVASLPFGKASTGLTHSSFCCIFLWSSSRSQSHFLKNQSWHTLCKVSLSLFLWWLSLVSKANTFLNCILILLVISVFIFYSTNSCKTWQCNIPLIKWAPQKCLPQVHVFSLPVSRKDFVSFSGFRGIKQEIWNLLFFRNLDHLDTLYSKVIFSALLLNTPSSSLSFVQVHQVDLPVCFTAWPQFLGMILLCQFSLVPNTFTLQNGLGY